MTNRLLAAVDTALDDIAEATDYAHPLVDPDAVAWLEAQADAGLGVTGDRWRRPHPNQAAAIKDDTCSCFDEEDGAVVCGWEWSSDAASPQRCDLAAFHDGAVGSVHAIVGTSEPVIPSNISRVAAMQYARAHHEPALLAEHARRLARRTTRNDVRYAWLGTTPRVPF